MTLDATMKAAEEGKEKPCVSIVCAGECPIEQVHEFVEGNTRVMDFRFQSAIGYTQPLSHKSATYY